MIDHNHRDYALHRAFGRFSLIDSGCTIWGHGAMLVTNRRGGVCDDCGREWRTKADVRHVYWDLTVRCTPCARIWVGLDAPT